MTEAIIGLVAFVAIVAAVVFISKRSNPGTGTGSGDAGSGGGKNEDNVNLK